MQPKQTAANNRTLKIVKRFFNGKIYKHAMVLMNNHGESAVMEYIKQFRTFEFVKAQIDGNTK